MVGQGPSANGQNNDFSGSIPIVGVNGCQNQASVLQMPLGIMYQNPSGQIWLLDRSLAEQYIGAQVETLSTGNLVTAAQSIPGTTTCLFSLNSGTNLLFDYLTQTWASQSYPTTVVDQAIFESQTLCYIDSSGLIHTQTPNAFSDNGIPIPMALKTGWLNFAGLEGYVRVWELQILGTYFSPHTLTVNIYSDYQTTPSQTVSIPVLTQPNLYQFRISIKQQQVEAMQIEIIESQTGSGAQGLSLSGLAFRVGIKTGLKRLPQTASY
jgi:hypothetical protein